MDARLHAERVGPGRGKRIWREGFGALPAGSFIQVDGAPCLVWGGRVLPWSHEGYGEPAPAPGGGEEVEVLTPASIVEMFRAEFRPQVDELAL